MGCRLARASLNPWRSLKVGDVRWQPVPVADCPRIKWETCMHRLWPVAGVNAGILWYIGHLVEQNQD